jgi:hypothetical protein
MRFGMNLAVEHEPCAEGIQAPQFQAVLYSRRLPEKPEKLNAFTAKDARDAKEGQEQKIES